ncbi:SixA phosphatase family protein [Caminibacter sp.]
MKILFIRHSLAVNRHEFLGHDFDRPLTRRGVKRAFRFFEIMKIAYPKIDYIITSKALRAKQTAEVLRKFYKNAEYEETSLLLPGSGINELKKVLNGKDGVVAIVGHEPDLSNMIKDIMHTPNLKIKLSKPSLVELEDEILKNIFEYKQIKDIYEFCKNRRNSKKTK